MKKTALFLLIVLLLTVTCSQDNDQLQKSVRSYNALLAEGYSEMNMNHLMSVATPEQATRVYHHMAVLGQGQVKMDPLLQSIRFSKVSQLSPEKAEVVTTEAWNYRYINLQTGKAGKDLSINYTVRYKLIKESGKWLIADVTILASDRKDDSEELPFFKRPADVAPGSAPPAEQRP